MTLDEMEPMSHSEMQQFLFYSIQGRVNDLQKEYRLENKRIADLFFRYLNERYIVEVKTELKFSIIEEALAKYSQQCEFLIIAAPPTQFRHVKRNQVLTWANTEHDKVGKLAVWWGRIDIIRHPLRLGSATGPEGSALPGLPSR